MNEKKLGQEPAFGSACANEQSHHIETGMSKRFYAACCAMQGFLSNTDFVNELGNRLKNEPNNNKFNECVCRASYMVADELLKQEDE